MKYKCLDCGHIFDRGEESRWVEGHGERMSGCPCCRGDYETTEECELCRGEFLREELFGGLCKDCIEEYRYNFDVCHKISLGQIECIEINSLLASLFDISDIEAILIEHIKSRHKKIDCIKFIKIDIDWFAENLAEEVKKNENGKK